MSRLEIGGYRNGGLYPYGEHRLMKPVARLSPTDYYEHRSNGWKTAFNVGRVDGVAGRHGTFDDMPARLVGLEKQAYLCGLRYGFRRTTYRPWRYQA